MSIQQNRNSDAAANNTTEDGVIAARRKDQSAIDSDIDAQSAKDQAATDKPAHVAQDASAPGKDLPEARPVEHGGQSGLEPTRYGDWEKKGRCTDF